MNNEEHKKAKVEAMEICDKAREECDAAKEKYNEARAVLTRTLKRLQDEHANQPKK